MNVKAEVSVGVLWYDSFRPSMSAAPVLSSCGYMHKINQEKLPV